MADAPATQKDLAALKKQIDDLRKWAQGEDEARAKDINKTIDALKQTVDQVNKGFTSLAADVNKAIGDVEKEIATLRDKVNEVIKAVNAK
jgi:hypothetical protein